MKAFDIFYTQEIEIYEKIIRGTYNKTETIIEHGTILADVQPYSGELLAKEYGVVEKCKYRIFCENSEKLKAGRYVRHDGNDYQIVYVASWDLGAEVMVKEMEV